MSKCVQREELVRVVRAGQWPQGCTPELREHVAACPGCSHEARLLSAFAVSRDDAMSTVRLQSAGLLWWRAQLRRRHEAMEKLNLPQSTISTAAIAASVLMLLAALATEWKSIEWSRWIAAFSSAEWNGWLKASILASLIGFALAAVLLSAETRKEHK